MTARVAWLLALSLLAVTPGRLGAQEPPEQPELTGRLTVEEEHDDNVNYGDGTVTPEVDDWVTRVKPSLTYLHPYRDHRFSLSAAGDYRHGADSGLSDLNADLGARADFNFSGGLGLVLADGFTHTRFDQPIFSEIGTTDSDSNVFAATVKYKKVDRLSGSLRFERTDQKYSLATTGDRSLNTLNGRLSVPVARRAVIYGEYLFQEQDSPTRIERRFDDHRAVGGLRFQGVARVTLFAEGGWERIRFDDPRQPDFEDPVGNAGVEMQFTGTSSGRFSIGRDGYGATVFLAAFDYKRVDSHEFRFLASRSTRNSFAVGALSSVYEGTIVSLFAKTRLGSKFTLGGEGAYFLYRPVEDLQFLDAETGTVRGYLLYNVQSWLLLGGHYHYARRFADRGIDEFTVNRAGATVQLVW